MKATLAILLATIATTAYAGQTGSFDTLVNRSWVCRSEAAMAEVMAQKTPSAMKATAESANCILLEAGTQIWTHGGNAEIAFGGVEGDDESVYYPVAAVE